MQNNTKHNLVLMVAVLIFYFKSSMAAIVTKKRHFRPLFPLTEREPRMSTASVKMSTYFGDPNAFALEIAAAQLPQHEAALVNLLEAAFECFPNRDYCVLALPSTTAIFPLLEHFVRVPPRPVSTDVQELYVMHRSALTGEMSVRVAVLKDLEAVENLVWTIVKSEKLISDFHCAVTDADCEYTAFVLACNGQTIGTAIVKEENDTEYVKTHYQLKQWLYENHHKHGCYGTITHFLVSPIFQRHSQFFIRELHRLSDYSILFYRVFPEDSVSLTRERSLACVLGDLLFVKPKTKPEFNHSDLEDCAPSEVVHRVDPPFALYCSTTLSCSIPRYEINTKIVVVGASNTSMAFLESLLFTHNKYYQAMFTNVTLVAPHGLYLQKPPSKIRDMLFVTQGHATYRYSSNTETLFLIRHQ